MRYINLVSALHTAPGPSAGIEPKHNDLTDHRWCEGSVLNGSTGVLADVEVCCGSGRQVGKTKVLYYITLTKSHLSLTVPICNGLSLVFFMVTSYLL